MSFNETNLIAEKNVQERTDFQIEPTVPLCCDNRTEWTKNCCAYVCYECDKHYINGSLANYCGIGCSWRRNENSGFDPSYAGETLEAEDNSWSDY